MLSPVGQVARMGMADVDPVILIHKRTPGTGHMEMAMGLGETEKFADAELAAGRFVFLELAGESTIIRKGKEIVEFVRRLFKPGDKPKVTTFAPMAGGAVDLTEGDADALEDTGTRMPPPIPDLRRRYDGPQMANAVGPGYPMEDRDRTARRAIPTQEVKAWLALVEKIGERAAMGIAVGGGFAVRSQLWPYVVYVVTPDIINVINQGVRVSQICIVPTDGGSIWDAVLDRIQLLQSGVDGETQVFATGALR